MSNNNYFDPPMTVYDMNGCPECCDCCCGGFAPTCSGACPCFLQMKNIIRQLIDLYPTNTVSIIFEDGGTVNGRPGSLFSPDGSESTAGLFLLEDSAGAVTFAASICKIASIRVVDGTYNPNIHYLTPSVSGCEEDCIRSWQAYLPVGAQDVTITGSGLSFGTGTVRASERGIIVLENAADEPIFISACNIETADK